MNIEISDILIGPNGLKYMIDKFTDDAATVILKALDPVSGEPVSVKIPTEELKKYTISYIRPEAPFYKKKEFEVYEPDI